MPIECYFSNDDGRVLKRYPQTKPGEVTFFTDYCDGEPAKIIGVEPLSHDLGGVIHVIDNEELIRETTHEDIPKMFSGESVHASLLPNATCSVELTSSSGFCGRLVVNHILPFSSSMN